MPIIFSTKAGTLASLENRLQSAKILPFLIFTITEWKKSREDCLSRVISIFGDIPWVVRSSCSQEDGSDKSNAGLYLSELNVNSSNFFLKVENVIASYGNVSDSEEILVQPMLQGVVRSGVAFSHDPNTCAPYRVINYSLGSDTTSITSGKKDAAFIWQQAANASINLPAIVGAVVIMIEELLTIFDQCPLDCEYAVTSIEHGEQLWLLQARPLILRTLPQAPIEQADKLKIIYQQVERGMRRHPFLLGKQSIYGVMPDWNPAEIIGIRPKPLSLSLYKELVTDSIWAYQRHNYGYRNLRSFPLMPHFLGLPYVDVRVSFNSFIPADLDDHLGAKLVDYYIDCLLDKPALHDKVEFEIVFSCYAMDTYRRLENIGLSREDREVIADSLRKLTNRILNDDSLWPRDAAKIDFLLSRRLQILNSPADKVEKIYWLLEDTKRYGTLPFAGLARIGFIAVQMLKSLVSVGVLTEKDYDDFVGDILTVSGEINIDRHNLGRVAFLEKYGHLRPGTYDILSPRYDEAPDLYFDWNSVKNAPSRKIPYSFTADHKSNILELLKANGLNSTPNKLESFIRSGIRLRELAKFHFTKNLSDVLRLITEIGQEYGYSKEDLAFCDISVFLEMHISAVNIQDLLSRSVDQGKARYAETLRISLPPLITSPEDVWGFEISEVIPNFITQRKITAPVIRYEPGKILTGGIICIPTADPGFDWLFSHSIFGLITAWGGVNSHMAIRAGELGIPAVIGVGEVLYEKWSSASHLHLDCSEKRVEVLG